MIEIQFSIDKYDKDGDCYEKGLYLHFGDTTVRVGDGEQDAPKLKAQIDSIVKEISENYHLNGYDCGCVLTRAASEALKHG